MTRPWCWIDRYLLCLHCWSWARHEHDPLVKSWQVSRSCRRTKLNKAAAL